MKTSRRQLIQTAALSSGAVALTSCERVISTLTQVGGNDVPEHLKTSDSADIDPDFHLLSRAAFGPWPGDLQRVKDMGREAWIEEQLQPESISDATCEMRAERFNTLFVRPAEAYNFKKPLLRDELTRHALLRAVYSQRQLFEVMVEFWTDHLNIDLNKGDCVYFKPADDREVIRQHALGNFRDLIRASATSPAMLVYLDGRTNKVTEKKPIPNENYGRELLELHTLGVNGGYAQSDVREAARCLTGWTVNLLKNSEGQLKQLFQPSRGVSYFNPELHDNGAKMVLGQTIPAGGGENDLEQLVDIVCQHPSTAKFIAKKLCAHFVSHNANEGLQQRVADEFTKTQGDIKSLLRVILKSDEFNAARGQLLKRPFRFIVSALRATAADTHAHQPLVDWLHRMGQGLFQYPTPDGYTDEEAPWMGTLLWRWNFALTLAGGKLPTVQIAAGKLRKALDAGHGKSADEVTAKLFAHFTGRKAQPHELEAIRGLNNEGEALGVLLASPAFQRC